MGKRKNKKYTYNEVKEIVNNLAFELISKEFVNINTKIIIKDKEGYLYYTSIKILKIWKTARKFHKSNPYTIQNIKLWCKLNNKPFELIDGQKYEGNKIKLNWKCLKEGCREEFKSDWEDIYHGNGCGYCRKLQVGLSNCLATKNQELAKEWHPTKNGDLTPYDVTCGSSKDVWWQCKDDPKHEWEVSVISRANSNSGCPYCAHTLPSEDYNLLICNSELCKEWNYDKNNKSPEDYCPNSGEKVWWKCKECGHEWEARIADRQKYSCPECSKSKGEKRCKQVFNSKNIYYIPQKEFKGLVGLKNGLLSYDFYIPKFNLLIEYQGEQHEKFIPYFHKTKKDFEKQVEHDRRKREYTLLNGYNFLEIWYYDYDNIETILDEYLSELEIDNN